jgi:hypothetical protein
MPRATDIARSPRRDRRESGLSGEDRLGCRSESLEAPEPDPECFGERGDVGCGGATGSIDRDVRACNGIRDSLVVHEARVSGGGSCGRKAVRRDVVRAA